MIRSRGSVPIAENWSAYLATCSVLLLGIVISILVEISNHCNRTRPAAVPETYVPGHGDLQTKADIRKRLKDAKRAGGKDQATNCTRKIAGRRCTPIHDLSNCVSADPGPFVGFALGDQTRELARLRTLRSPSFLEHFFDGLPHRGDKLLQLRWLLNIPATLETG